MYGYIYLTTNLVNGKKYVGRHKSNVKDNSYFGSGSILKEAIKKYGKSNFTVDILEWCNSREELYEKEKFWIEKLNAVEDSNFYNIDNGGSGPQNVPPEVRQRLREAFCGEKNPAKRPEVREKIRQSKLGSKNAMYGTHQSDSVIEKLRLANLGSNNHMYGKHHSEESKKKMRSAKLGKPSHRKRKVIICGVEYESVTDAMKKLNICTRKLYKMIEKDGDVNVREG